MKFLSRHRKSGSEPCCLPLCVAGNRALTPIFLAGVLAACSPGGAQDKKGAAAPSDALVVTTVEMTPRTVPVSFEAVGRTEGSREVQVRARVSGILERQLYNEGDTVAAGAPLFRIERAPFEIELASARGALAQELAREELARQESERLKGLADRRAISQKEADQANSAARQSAAAVQVAQARVRGANLGMRLAAGIGLGFLYFVVDGLALAMGESGAILPVVSAWAPVLAFGSISGTVLLWIEGL